jgi:endoglucanase
MRIEEYTRQLCRESGPSGFETAVADRAEELLRPLVDETWRDVMGNLFGLRRCGKEGAKRLLLDAHMDEVGFIVTEITEGFLRFSAIGGVDSRMLPGREVTVLGKETLYGVIDCLPPHVLTAEQREQAVQVKDVYIDLGLSQEEAEKLVPIGSPGVFRGDLIRLQGDTISGKALDDRLCAAVLLSTLEELKGADLPCDLVVMLSTQEEVGCRGAKPGIWSADPDWCIAVDVTFARTPDSSEPGTFKAGSGCTIGVGPNANRNITEALMATAKEKEIPYSIEVLPGNSGTNGWPMQVSRQGVATAIVSVPIKYMHSPVETARLCDAETAVKLLTEFVRGGALK